MKLNKKFLFVILPVWILFLIVLVIVSIRKHNKIKGIVIATAAPENCILKVNKQNPDQYFLNCPVEMQGEISSTAIYPFSVIPGGVKNSEQLKCAFPKLKQVWS